MFEKLGYEVVRNVITEQTLELLKRQFELAETYAKHMFPEQKMFGDSLVRDDAFSTYGHHASESLLEMLLPKVQDISNKKILPTYSFYRNYYKNSVLKKHTDRPECEISVTLCIASEGDDWPIWLEDLNGKETSVDLNPGDMCVYKGMDCPHWREPYTGRKQIQTFLHYVDAKGKYSSRIFDGRDLLGLQDPTL
jgi:hypothetical protein